MNIAKNIRSIREETDTLGVHLVAVSKTKSPEEIREAYDAGQRVFGENIVQELMDKRDHLPDDIQWHMIGHLQTNKVKYIAPFIQMIHSVDSFKVLKEINKRAKQHERVIDCLLQIFIASEESKFGLDHVELIELLNHEGFAKMKNIRIRGLMGIATNTPSEKVIKEEYYELKTLFDGIKVSYFRQESSFDILSMGMSSDYKIAIEQGSNMIRLGSTIFGARPETQKDKGQKEQGKSTEG